MEGQYYDAHALLFLDRQVTLSTKVGTVCLPEKNDNFDGRVCLAAGGQFFRSLRSPKVAIGAGLGIWKFLLSENKEPDEFVVVPRGECEKALQEKSLGEEFKLHYSFMCAERVNKSKTARVSMRLQVGTLVFTTLVWRLFPELLRRFPSLSDNFVGIRSSWHLHGSVRRSRTRRLERPGWHSQIPWMDRRGHETRSRQRRNFLLGRSQLIIGSSARFEVYYFEGKSFKQCEKRWQTSAKRLKK